jgi:hypothetical protein
LKAGVDLSRHVEVRGQGAKSRILAEERGQLGNANSAKASVDLDVGDTTADLRARVERRRNRRRRDARRGRRRRRGRAKAGHIPVETVAEHGGTKELAAGHVVADREAEDVCVIVQVETLGSSKRQHSN